MAALRLYPNLICFQARVYEQGISDMLVHARSIVNSFHITVRTPPEMFSMVASYLTEEDLFSASQVCQLWRSVLTSLPSLWTRFSCRRVPRTTASLKRCGSLPIHLRLDPPFSNAALEDVLLHGNEINSLTVNHRPNKVPHFPQLLKFSRPSVQRLHVYAGGFWGWGAREQPIRELWQDLPLLRDLFVSRYPMCIDQFNAPNLVNLALQRATEGIRVATVQNILHVLRGCPLLETLLLNLSLSQDALGGHSPISLPRLRSVEVSVNEVLSGLIPYLDLPPTSHVGFRTMRSYDVCDNTPLAITAAIQHVLGRIDPRSITLATPPQSQWNTELFIRFEGPQGSLEITTVDRDTGQWPPNLLHFGSRGVLFSHRRIEEVRELHVIGCPFDDDQGFDGISLAMPNVVSASFFHYSGPHISEVVAHTSSSSPPFPHLERVMVLGSELELEEMVRRRRDIGVPLKALVIGEEHGSSEYSHLEDYSVLGGLVGDLRVGCPTEILEWGSTNEIHNLWSAVKEPGPVSPRGTWSHWA